MLLYYDIAAIGNRKAQEILNRPFLISDANIRLKHLIELARALQMHKGPMYNNLRKKLRGEIGDWRSHWSRIARVTEWAPDEEGKLLNVIEGPGAEVSRPSKRLKMSWYL